jgi:hypothetical protein
MAFNYSDPTVIVSGDTYKWSAAFEDYSAASGYSLNVRLAGTTVLTVTGSASSNPNDFDIVLTASSSATLSAGTYNIAYQIVSGSERYTVRESFVTVLADPAASTAGSRVLFAEKGLAAVQSALLARVDPTHQTESYSIAGRSVTLIPTEELLRLRNYFANELARLRGKTGFGYTLPVVFRPVW